MRDWIPELPDLQRLMMPGGAVGQNNRFSLSSNKQTPTAMRCTHEENPFKRCMMYYNMHALITQLLWSSFLTHHYKICIVTVLIETWAHARIQLV